MEAAAPLDENSVQEEGSKTTLGLNNNDNMDVSTEVPTPEEKTQLSPVVGEQDAQIPEEETPSPVVPAAVDVVPSTDSPSPLTSGKSPTRKRKRSASASTSSSSSLSKNTDVTKKIKKLEAAVKTLTRKVSAIEHNIPKCLLTRKRKISKKPRTLP